MAENSYENSGKDKPQPQFEIPKQPEVGRESQTERALEQPRVSENTPAKQSPKFPAQPPAVLPAVTPDPSSQATDDDQTSKPSLSKGLSAQNTDLIERQWVERAKAIVDQTQDDPYKQKSEMSKMKADYIKKRFDKTIPVDDAVKS